MRCRFCAGSEFETFVNLGSTPLANSYLDDPFKAEAFYPLHAKVCTFCFLVQLDKFESPSDIFSDYAYFSSQSNSWLQHSKDYVNHVCVEFNIPNTANVIEVASNDGYLLQYFKEKGFTNILGIEPAANVAKKAMEKGVNTEVSFFGSELIDNKGYKADLIIANNVLAHTPYLNDFVSALKKALNPKGIITIEVPHLAKLVSENQFDTIYHEHFSYFSLGVLCRLFCSHDLFVFGVDELETHGGSLRLYISHLEDLTKSSAIGKYNCKYDILKREEKVGLTSLKYYQDFSAQVKQFKLNALEKFIHLKKQSNKIIAYGAPAKGNTLLNYLGIDKDFIDYAVDTTPYKQGKWLPGSRIPIYEPAKLYEDKPEIIYIQPWNWKKEIIDKLTPTIDWTCSFLVKGDDRLNLYRVP